MAFLSLAQPQGMQLIPPSLLTVLRCAALPPACCCSTCLLREGTAGVFLTMESYSYSSTSSNNSQQHQRQSSGSSLIQYWGRWPKQ